MQEIPFRSHQFEPPTHPPFDKIDCWWPTVVGEFFRPIVTVSSVEAFVFLNHRGGEQNDVELRFASQNFVQVESKMDQLMQQLGIIRKSVPTDGETVGRNAYHGTRWISDQKIHDADQARRRSELVFRFLHAGCALFLDCLVQDGAQWRIERNTDRENPRGNIFESQLHLISNFSEARFDVYMVQTGLGMAAATTWMLPKNIQPLAHIGICNL
jgi:hypothetical protein